MYVNYFLAISFLVGILLINFVGYCENIVIETRFRLMLKGKLVLRIRGGRTNKVLYCMVWHGMVWYGMVWYVIVLYCIVSYRIVSYCIVLYCIALHCIVLYCIALYCIVLYCIIL